MGFLALATLLALAVEADRTVVGDLDHALGDDERVGGQAPDLNQAVVAQAGGGTGAAGTTNRDMFLKSIDGLMYGDDPHQGIVEGNKFVHPDMKLAFQAPNGGNMNGWRWIAIDDRAAIAELVGFGALHAARMTLERPRSSSKRSRALSCSRSARAVG